jgi:hypothetical protein
MEDVKATDTIKELYIKVAIMKHEIKKANRLIQTKEREALRKEDQIKQSLSQSHGRQ